jgi:precorrin-6B methylase 1
MALLDLAVIGELLCRGDPLVKGAGKWQKMGTSVTEHGTKKLKSSKSSKAQKLKKLKKLKAQKLLCRGDPLVRGAGKWQKMWPSVTAI